MNDLLLRKEVLDFIFVAHHLNFSKTADALGVSQAGLSKSIKKLEDEIEAKLFIRGSRALRLTSFGSIYLKYALKAKDFSSAANTELSSNSNDLQGQFILQSHTVLLKTFLPELIKELNRNSNIQIDVRLSSSRMAVEAVKDANADLAIVIDPIHYPDLIIKKLWKENIALYSNAGKKQKHVLYHSQMVGVQGLLAQTGGLPKQIDDYSIISSMLVQLPEFMGILPNPVAEEHKGLIKIQKFKDLNCCLVYRSDSPKNQSLSLLVRTIRELKH